MTLTEAQILRRKRMDRIYIECGELCGEVLIAEKNHPDNIKKQLKIWARLSNNFEELAEACDDIILDLEDDSEAS